MPSKIEFKTEKRKISDLKGCDYNPRQLTKKQYNDLKKSISKFSYAEIALINTNNTIVAGHQRLKILKELKGSDYVVDVRVPNRELTKEEFDEYLIRSNKNIGEWDWDILANDFEIDDLKDWGFEDSEFGFGFEDEEEETEGDDETPEPPEEPITVKGDLYELGTHRLVCGDSFVITDVEKLMDGKKADMVFTDPPYGIDVVGGAGRVKAGEYRAVIGDDEDYNPSHIFACFPDAKYILWGANYYSDKLTVGGRWFVWDKNRGEGTTFSDCELAWSNIKGIVVKKYKVTWDGMNREGESGKRVHPTQKPVLLSAKMLTDFHHEKVIVDLFGGSGSTMIACEKTNRDCRMMELDPKYCDVIVKRYIDFCMTNNRPFSVKRNGKDIGEFK